MVLLSRRLPAGIHVFSKLVFRWPGSCLFILAVELSTYFSMRKCAGGGDDERKKVGRAVSRRRLDAGSRLRLYSNGFRSYWMPVCYSSGSSLGRCEAADRLPGDCPIRCRPMSCPAAPGGPPLWAHLLSSPTQARPTSTRREKKEDRLETLAFRVFRVRCGCCRLAGTPLRSNLTTSNSSGGWVKTTPNL